MLPVSNVKSHLKQGVGSSLYVVFVRAQTAKTRVNVHVGLALHAGLSCEWMQGSTVIGPVHVRGSRRQTSDGEEEKMERWSFIRRRVRDKHFCKLAENKRKE